MTGAELGLLWLGWAIAGASPGPATMALAGTSMKQGRQAGLALALGILVGSATWGIAAALGMSAVMVGNAWIFTTLRYAGAAYLLFLAYKSMRSAFSRSDAKLQAAITGTTKQVFLKGVLLHLTNPKAILAWGAIYAIVLPEGATSAEVFSLFGFLYLASLIVFPSYAILFSTRGMVSTYQRLKRWFEGTFAVLFGAASLKILTTRGFE
ncbi:MULTISPECIES: LysE family translocator [Halocynthiibacter]|uniref:LysE family translocator n=1 Tax=Halocynthiibacter halioticoli TaxID=2986804 RepID=A0AAE3LU92_9RHOB|nr:MULTISPECIES: LysE family translocator [Halocynthiibacter]MCV6823260.1 LysE family translocator [Halocynthiibacter halioticoli]MCW4056261.1 LysE family translocator [Halocynthiibacter sp. SDUM655004]